MKIVKPYILGICMLALPLTFSESANADVIFLSDFETGSIQERSSSPDGWSTGTFTGDAYSVQSSVKRSGNYALKLHLNKADWPRPSPQENVKPRSQLIKTKGSGGELTLNKEHWVGVSVFIPNDWVNDYSDNPDVLWQFHGVNGGPGSGSSPPLYLRVVGGKFVIITRNEDNNGNFKAQTIWTGPLEKGRWIDWVMRVKFAYGSDGIAEIWKDGTKIINHKGSTIYHADKQTNETGPYFMLSIYKPKWIKEPSSAKTRTVYYDEVRIAGPGSSYNDVAPSGSTIPFISSPVISDILTSVTDTEASISWATNGTLVTKHNVTLMGLMPDTKYNYQVSSTDTNGNTSSTADLTFTTTNTVSNTSGNELVKNGDFTNGTTDWISYNNASLMVVSDELEIANTTGENRPNVRQTINGSKKGKTYRVLADITKVEGSNSPSLEIWEDSALKTQVSINNTGTNAVEIDYTANQDNFEIRLLISGGTPGDKAYFDNISIKEIQ